MCLVVFLAVSCRVYKGDNHADSYILEETSENLFGSYVSAPVIFVDWMQDFDGYLFGENASCNGFAGGNVVQTGENAYHIDGFGLVDTGGKSLDEPGAVWSLTAESYARWTGSSSLQCFGTANDEPLSLTVTCGAENAWELSVSSQSGRADLAVTKHDYEIGNGTYEARGDGSFDDGDYSVVFSIGPEGLTMVRDDNGVMYGSFKVEFMNGEQTLDTCVMSFYGNELRFTTSRD